MIRPLSTILAAGLLIGACVDAASDAVPANGSASVAAAPAAPSATGRVIEIKAVTDDRGNYFEPSEIEARRGDVLRVVLVSGVHNLNFLADSNPSGVALPTATDMLQLPGQTVDIPITMPEGEYYFQCDPHALLGMIGELEVED